MGRRIKLTKEELKRLKKRYEQTRKVRGQWAMLMEEFGYKSPNGLRGALYKAGVLVGQ